MGGLIDLGVQIIPTYYGPTRARQRMSKPFASANLLTEMVVLLIWAYTGETSQDVSFRLVLLPGTDMDTFIGIIEQFCHIQDTPPFRHFQPLR